MDIEQRVYEVLAQAPAGVSLQLVGSRQRGEPTPLSDWDFRIEAPDCPRLVAALPDLVARLGPLGSLWDPLSQRAVFMVVLPGAIKVDFFPCDELREIQPPWRPSADSVIQIDAHFWDWMLWLGGKALRPDPALIDLELGKLCDFLLGPLGVEARPSSIASAIEAFVAEREKCERRYRVDVPRQLGDEVTSALAKHRII